MNMVEQVREDLKQDMRGRSKMWIDYMQRNCGEFFDASTEIVCPVGYGVMVRVKIDITVEDITGEVKGR